MPPNVVDFLPYPDPENAVQVPKAPNGVSAPVQKSEASYKLEIFQSSLNFLAHLFIGIVVGISLLFSFRNGLPLGATSLHIVLCVIGYQLLMAESILAMTSENGWSSKLRLVDKRRAHWILQILGSGLAIAGSIIKFLDSSVHWNTLHGQFALVAMVFTVSSLISGFISLYAYEFRRFLPGNLTKLIHVLFGIVAFAAATISLCYGFDKNSFKNWATEEFTYTIMAFTAAFTAICIINPTLTFIKKTLYVVKK